jgi:hypothetical protein
MAEKDAPKEMHLIDNRPADGAFGHSQPHEQKGHGAPLQEGHARPTASMQSAAPPPPPPPTAGSENIGKPSGK